MVYIFPQFPIYVFSPVRRLELLFGIPTRSHGLYLIPLPMFSDHHPFAYFTLTLRLSLTPRVILFVMTGYGGKIIVHSIHHQVTTIDMS